MLIIFNTSGSLTNIDFQNDSFSQGDNNVHTIDVIIDDTRFKNGSYNCYIQFLREGETTPSPKLIMTKKVILYNDARYSGFGFQMSSDWYTAIAGVLKATIEIKQYDENGLQSNKAYGVINIPVMESVSGESGVETTITNEEYIALINALNEKANINTENTFSERQYFKENLYISKDICSEGNDHFVAGANSEGGYVYLENADAHKAVSIKPNRIELECENKKKSISLNPGEDAIEISDLYISNRLSVEERATFNGETIFNDSVKVGNNTYIKDQEIIIPEVKTHKIHITDGEEFGEITYDSSYPAIRFQSGYRPIWDDNNGSVKELATTEDYSSILWEDSEGVLGTNEIYAYQDIYSEGNIKSESIVEGRILKENGVELKDKYATPKYVDEKVANLVNSAPETLDTLGELATALENHKDAYDSLLEVVGKKADATPNPKFDSVNIDDKIFIDSEEGFYTGGVRLNSDGLHLEGATANSGYTKITHKEIEHNDLTYQYPQNSGTLVTSDDIGSTAIPEKVGEYVGSVYFNTSLSYEEVEKIIDEALPDIKTSSQKRYHIIKIKKDIIENDITEISIRINYSDKTGYIILINKKYQSGVNSDRQIFNKVYGWGDPEIILDGNIFEVDNSLIRNNEGLKSLIGTISFDGGVVSKTLENYKSIKEIEGKLIGSVAIPEEVGEHVGSVYFNTSLSKEEVANIIKQAIPYLSSDKDYCILDTETTSGVKIIIRFSSPNIYSIFADIHLKNNEYMQAVFFNSSTGWFNLVPSYPVINKQTIIVDKEIANVDSSYTRNNAGLKSLISTIPFDGGLVSKTLEIEEKLNSGAGGGNSQYLTEITYSELKTLRDNGNLIPGMQYKITDYETITAQYDTRSAGNQFDIIVVADSENTLNENARASLHSGDTYFANNKLNAWKLKYCLDNDTSRFAWAIETQAIVNIESGMSNGSLLVRQPLADGGIPDIEYQYAWGTQVDADDGDATNFIYSKNETLTDGEVVYIAHSGREEAVEIITGKGVIYRMIDEFNNDLPYDFKNIQFPRVVSLENGHPSDGRENGTLNWVYTFCANSYHIDNDEWSELKDGSLESPGYHQSDEGTTTFVNNTIKPYYEYYDENNEDYRICGRQYLNDNVFFGYWEEIGSSSDEESNPYYYACCAFNNTIGYNSNYNTMNNTFANNTIGNNFNANIIGQYFQNNTIGNHFLGNQTTGSFTNNTIGDAFRANIVGTNFANNIIGNICEDNTIEYGFRKNTIGNVFSCNTIGKDFSNNAIGNGFYNNTISLEFNYNTIGNEFNYNTIEINFQKNTIGNDFLGNVFNSFTNFVVENNIFENSIQYIYLLPEYSLPNPKKIQYLKICSGIQGVSSTNKQPIKFDVGMNYQQEFKLKGSITTEIEV